MVWGLVILIGVVPAWAITADEILDEVEACTAESETKKAIAKMILVDSKGREEVREVIMASKRRRRRRYFYNCSFFKPSRREKCYFSLEGERACIFTCRLIRKCDGLPVQKKVRNLWAPTLPMMLGGSYSREDYDSTLDRRNRGNL